MLVERRADPPPLVFRPHLDMNIESLWVIVIHSLPIGSPAYRDPVFAGDPALVFALGVAVSVGLRPTFRGAGALRPDDVQAVVDVREGRIVFRRKGMVSIFFILSWRKREISIHHP